MAITSAGTPLAIATSSSSGAQSITVPTCDLVVLFHVGAQDSTDTVFDSGGASFTLGGAPIPWVARTPTGDYIDSAVHILLSPSSGTLTFEWSGVTETSSSPLFLLVFYAGTGVNNPVYDQDSASNAQSIAGLSIIAGSMTVACIGSYAQAPVVSGSGQTPVVSGQSDTTYAAVAEKVEAASMDGTNGNYPCIIAIVLQQTSVNSITVAWVTV